MKLVTFSTSDGERVKGSGYQVTIPTLSAMQAFKMLKKGRQGYLCTIEDTEPRDVDLNKIPVAREYQGYHLTEKSSLPSNLSLELPQYLRHLIEWHLLN